MAGALIGALRVSLSAETSSFEAGMRRSQRTAKQTANSIQGSFKGIGNTLKASAAGFVSAISVGSIVAAGKAALDYAGSLGEVADQLGVTSRELQIFRFAAAQNGASMEQADQALGKLTLSISKALSGSKEATAAFKAVGVSLEDLRTKSRTEIIGQIADQMQKTGGASANAAAGVQIFGRGFQKIVPTLDQGSKGFDELAAAADRLGIVLTEEQISKADETADKLDALQTVLKAKIAGVVADNADAILTLAETLASLVQQALDVPRALLGVTDGVNGLAQVTATALSPLSILVGLLNQLRGGGAVTGFNVAGSSVTVPLGKAVRKTGVPTAFLGGGGGGRSRRGGGGRDDAERKRQEALRDQNRFDQDIRRANIDILNAKRDLAADAVEQYAISIQIKDAERAAYEAQLRYEVAVGDRSKVEAEALQAAYDQKDSIERQKLIADENARAAEESAKLDDLQFDLERDRLQSEQQLAETASEQRDIQLRLLDLAYRQERARLQTIIADEQSSDAAKEEARRRLLNLNRTYNNDRQGVLNNTRGPLEDYMSRLPLDAAKYNEALENVAANGLKSIEDGLLDIITGTKSVKSAFHEMAAAILADLLRIAIQKYVIGTIMKIAGLGSADGGSVGSFAYGGFVSGPGGPREDRVPAMLSNGEFVINAKATKKFLPLLEAINSGVPRMAQGGLLIPRASYGSRAYISNDNGAMQTPVSVTFHNDFRGADPSAVAAIEARLNRMQSELPSTIVSTVQEANSRFVLRGR